jgi:hypothetical protein
MYSAADQTPLITADRVLIFFRTSLEEQGPPIHPSST